MLLSDKSPVAYVLLLLVLTSPLGSIQVESGTTSKSGKTLVVERTLSGGPFHILCSSAWIGAKGFEKRTPLVSTGGAVMMTRLSQRG
jgi:hypothetical protein